MNARSREEFNPELFLNSQSVAKRVSKFEKSEIVYSQGEDCASVLYIQSGTVKLSAVNESGKEAILAILEAGDFLGVSCLSGAPPELEATAIAMEATIVFEIPKKEMGRVLQEDQDFRSYFMSYLLRRNARTEADLIDLLRNSSEKRLARALLLLARRDREGWAKSEVLSLPQETLAGLIGTTRSRVNVFMNKFRKLGFIDYSNGKLQVHSSLIRGVLQD
jgi:CRP/FNR family cyclic AMP-dependent transcriptional regulator